MEVDLARGEAWKESLNRSRARRAAKARARLRRLRIRGSAVSLLAAAMVCAVVGAGIAVGKSGSRPAAGESSGVLKVGSRGPAVEALQGKLGIAADGVFGSLTERAVKRFQRRRGLAVDGVAGPQTLGALGVSAATGPPRSSSGRVAGTLRRIALCESGGNPRAVSRDGRYRGKYQFDRATWRGVGGRGDPAKAPEAEQDRRAAALLRRHGTSPWGRCA
jgi:hypothetical protein